MAKEKRSCLSLWAVALFVLAGSLFLPCGPWAAETAVVSSYGSGRVTFIDIENAQVSASVQLPDRASLPLDLAITPDASLLVVACETGYVSFLGNLKGTLGLWTVPLLAGPESSGLTLVPNEFSTVAITPDGNTALVGESNEQGQVYRFDIESATWNPPWTIGDGSQLIVVKPDGLQAYVVDDALVHIVNLSNGTFTTVAPLGAVEGIGGLALVPNTSRAVLTNPNDDRIALVNTATWTVLDQEDVAPGRFAEPSSVAMSPDGTLAIVANYADQSITFVGVSSTSLTVAQTINVGGTAGGVIFSQDGQSAVVTLVNTSLVKIIDVVNREVRGTVSGGLGLAPLRVVTVADLPSWASDGDQDGHVAAVDCDNANRFAFPGAPEVLDGVDNQCAGDPGYGEVDEGMEVTGLVFIASPPGAPKTLCWDQLSGVTGYEVTEAEDPLFFDSCGSSLSPPTACATTDPVPPGEVRFYLVHAFGCFPICVGGTWGQNSAEVSRTISCSQYPTP